jgi:hypothetical protein
MLRQPDTGAEIPLTNHCKPNELSGTKSFMNYDKNTFFPHFASILYMELCYYEAVHQTQPPPPA